MWAGSAIRAECRADDAELRRQWHNQAGAWSRKITPGGVVTTFASNAYFGIFSATGLAFDSSGDLYAAVGGNNTILKFTPGGVGTVFADGTDGLSNPQFLAFTTLPEPTGIITGLFCLGLAVARRRRSA